MNNYNQYMQYVHLYKFRQSVENSVLELVNSIMCSCTTIEIVIIGKVIGSHAYHKQASWYYLSGILRA